MYSEMASTVFTLTDGYRAQPTTRLAMERNSPNVSQSDGLTVTQSDVLSKFSRRCIAPCAARRASPARLSSAATLPLFPPFFSLHSLIFLLASLPPSLSFLSVLCSHQHTSQSQSPLTPYYRISASYLQCTQDRLAARPEAIPLRAVARPGPRSHLAAPTDRRPRGGNLLVPSLLQASASNSSERRKRHMIYINTRLSITARVRLQFWS
ncbi:hypothetical protein P389DRAFT_74848 [Cystobasidium minutum MCA 4210]|uniref:uncharacterized protein n=1 Tax=Cystobasidium minutum MCA 4210 TaxID=1397322 RepID=UPI0034CE299F|eukprot:jgi/Rhomi1/74848/CE74847_63